MARKKSNSELPTFDQLMIPTVKAIILLGGSASVEEINSKVIEISNLPESVLQQSHPPEGNLSEVEYRLAWSRTYLKKFGLLENSSRGIWALSKGEINPDKINSDEIVRRVRDEARTLQAKKTPLISKIKLKEEGIPEVEDLDESELWKENLIGILYGIPPDSFERLAQRILRESGFSQVEVTGKVGDGGIDGKGIVRVSGLLSFHVIFQCKRYRGSISPSQIRDFRGAMQGRADKGLFITTGTFTREAMKEATRDGAPPIDLIDGEVLCEKLKELKLGVATIQKEIIQISREWFAKL